MTSAARTPKALRTRQAEVARTAALDAVIAALAHGELDELTMPQVAQAAGLSLRTLYRYFPSREELLHAAGAEIQARLALPIEVATPEDIVTTFWAASGRLARSPELARALVRTTAGRAAHASTRSARVEAIQAALAPLTAGLPATRARQVAGVITHLCSSTAWVSISDESQLAAADARSGVRWALTVLLDALGTEQPTTEEASP
jgi:AcrR family transcriptional regulator